MQEGEGAFNCLDEACASLNVASVCPELQFKINSVVTCRVILILAVLSERDNP